MRTSWIVSFALIGFGCSSTSSHLEAPREEKPPIVSDSVPVRGGTGDKDAAEVVELAHARMTEAYEILAAHGSCFLPAGGGSLDSSSSAQSVDPKTRPPLPAPGERAGMTAADWARYDPNREDYDFLGVDVDLSPDGRAVVVTSKFGDVPGLLRVVEWIREKLKP